MIRMNGGGRNDLHVYRYWLLTELHHYYFMLKNEIILRRKSRVLNEFVDVTKEEYAAAMTKYYLQMMYLPWFTGKGISALGLVDYDKMVKLLLSQDIIQSLINTPHENLVQVRG